MYLKFTFLTLISSLFVLTTSCGQPHSSRLRVSELNKTSEHNHNGYKETNDKTDSLTDLATLTEEDQNQSDKIPVYKLKDDQAGTDLTSLPENEFVPEQNQKHYDMQPLAWDKHSKYTSSWSKTIYSTIKTETPELLGQNIASDVEIFCPKYQSLNENQRLNFWGQFIVALSKYESSWNPTTSVVETLMKGNDPVTKKHIASEGLLQLSYQDEKNYRMDCGFDYEKDKYLHPNDPQKTILNPHLNLKCGIRILASQLRNKGSIVLKEKVYWAPLREGSKRIPQIAAITKKLIFCN